MSGRRDNRSPEAKAYRRLYQTDRWFRLRTQQLSDYPLCAMCLPRVVAAEVCDHVDKDSKATEEGFFRGPFQSLCKVHHDSTRQREEKRGHAIGCDENGIPLDPNSPWRARGESETSGQSSHRPGRLHKNFSIFFSSHTHGLPHGS